MNRKLYHVFNILVESDIFRRNKCNIKICGNIKRQFHAEKIGRHSVTDPPIRI